MTHLHHTSTKLLPGLLLAISGTLLFSLKPILFKQAFSLGVDSTQMMTLRMLIAAPVYLLILFWIVVRQPQAWSQVKQHGWAIFSLGVFGYYLASYLDLTGLQYVSAQLERILLFCYPTLVVLMSKWFLKTPLPRFIWIQLATSYLGVYLIFSHDMASLGSDVLWGTILILCSAIIYAGYVLFSKRYIDRIGSRLFTSLAMLASSIGISCHFLITHSITDLAVSQQALSLAAIIALFCTVIPALLISEAIRRIGPEQASIVGTIGPVMTSAMAVFMLDESFTIFHFGGLVLVIFSISLMLKK